MLEKIDYLQFGKRGQFCTGCGKSLVEDTRHPSILVDEEGLAGMPAAAVPATAQGESAAPPAAAASVAVPPAAAGAQGSDKSAGGEKKGTAGEEPQPFHRFDFCADCWERKKQAGYFSYWIGHRTPADIPKKRLNRSERNQALAALFDSLAERSRGDQDYGPHLFFLAHLLMRFKIFKWESSEPDPATGRKMIRFSRSGIEDPILVADQDLPDETIVAIKAEIESYLETNTGQIVRL